MNEIDDKPWLEFMTVPVHWRVGTERHAVKVINFRSPRLPSPPLLAAVHIDRVNRLSFFKWTPDGVLEMHGREAIPQFTVIGLVSVVTSGEAVHTYGLPYRTGEKKPYGHSSRTSRPSPRSRHLPPSGLAMFRRDGRRLKP